MSLDDARPEGEAARLDVLARVDDLADEFEAAWQSLTPPCLDDYLHRAAGEPQALLRQELLKIDRAYRVRLSAAANTSAPVATAPPVPSVTGNGPVLPGYEVLGELGRGGMGVVYQARQKSLGRLVALKLLSAGSGERQRQRFLAESQTVARLQHPNIVQIHEVGEHDGRPYLALEYVDGGSLARHLAGAPVPARTAAQLVETLARAVQYAHEHGVVHRDLKPANVLLQRGNHERHETHEKKREENQQPEQAHDGSQTSSSFSSISCLSWSVPKLTDFGLAKQLDSDIPADQTRTGEILGTPSYMAPEQTEGKPQAVGPAVDIYALGAILYELLTGRPPFKGETTLATLEQVRSQEPVPPSRLLLSVSRDLETICLKALAKEPGRRYASAGALADDLHRFLDGRPIQARPVGYGEKLWRWCRRNPVGAGLLAVSSVAILALAGLVVGLVYGERLAQALRQAEEHRAEAEKLRREMEHPLNLKLALQAWRNADLRQMRDLLAGEVPGPGQEDLRGFAWYHLWELAHSERRTLEGHAGDVYSVAFSRDSRTLATAGKDGTVRLWDAASGKALAVLEAHAAEAAWATFSPDGRALASCGGDGKVRLWDVATGNLRATLVGHTRSVVAVEFSPDGKLLASGGKDRTIKLWDAATGREQKTLDGHGHYVEALAFSPDGQTLASASRDGTARLWDVAAGKERAALRGHEDWVRGVSLSPDGRRLATAGSDGTVRLWDAATGHLEATLPAHVGWVQAVAFSPDGQSVVSCGSDSRVCLWDVAAKKLRNLFQGHTARVWGVAFAPDGRTLATAGADGLVKLWVPEKRQVSLFLEWPREGFRSLAFSPDSRLLASNCGGEKVQLHDAATGQARAVLEGPSGSPEMLAFAPDGRTLAAGWTNGRVFLWDPPAQPRLLQAREDKLPAFSVAFSPDGRWLAAGQEKHITVWEAATGARHTAFPAHGTEITGLAFSPDGRTLASAGRDDLLKLWDTATWKARDAAERRHRFPILGLAYAPDGRLLATGSADRTVKLWDAATGRERATLLGHRDTVAAVAFCPDGRTLASGSYDGTVRLWDITTRQELLTLEGHTGQVVAVAFSPDGRVLASGGRSPSDKGGELHVWRAADRDLAARVR